MFGPSLRFNPAKKTIYFKTYMQPTNSKECQGKGRKAPDLDCGLSLEELGKAVRRLQQDGTASLGLLLLRLALRECGVTRQQRRRWECVCAIVMLAL